MPVCTWCGIESKSDLVCDWCKRPLALRASRKPGDRTAVDLLKDPDEGQGLTPRVMAGIAVVGIGLLLVVAWAMTSRQPAESVASTQPNPEFVATREDALKPPPVPSEPARPLVAPRSAFLPGAARQSKLEGRDLNMTAGVGSEFNRTVAQGPVASLIFRMEMYDEGFKSSSGPSVRIGGGVLKSTGGKRGLAVGRVSVSNTTEGTVVDFRLEAVINGVTYSLQPFQGSPDKQRSLGAKTIKPGEKLTVPVYVVGYNGGKKSMIVPARIVLNAWLDSGQNSIIKDELLTP